MTAGIDWNPQFSRWDCSGTGRLILRPVHVTICIRCVPGELPLFSGAKSHIIRYSPAGVKASLSPLNDMAGFLVLQAVPRDILDLALQIKAVIDEVHYSS